MAGNLEFIKSASGTIVSSLSVTDCFSADYDVYYLSITKIDQSANGTAVKYRFLDSSNTAISDSSYDQATLVMQSGGSFTESRTTNQTNGFGAAGYGMRDPEDGRVQVFIFLIHLIVQVILLYRHKILLLLLVAVLWKDIKTLGF